MKKHGDMCESEIGKALDFTLFVSVAKYCMGIAASSRMSLSNCMFGIQRLQKGWGVFELALTILELLPETMWQAKR